MVRRSLLAVSLLLPLAACADDLGSSDAAISEGTVEGVGVLRFLNSPAADVTTLDIDAALDARAARNIVSHVRGPDGALGTSDDDLLDSIAELDAISYVGDSAIGKLVAYVDSIGGIPSLEVEGVLLTAGEAAAIVDVANGASLPELDDDAALDARAARALVDGRPFGDVYAVSRASYVGASALEKLRRFAATWQPAVSDACDPQVLAGMRGCVEAQLADDPGLATADAAASCADAEALGPVFDAACGGALPPGFCAGSYEDFYATAVPACVDALAAELAPLCRTQADCGAAPMRCQGFASDGASVFGVCIDSSNVPGAGAQCTAEDACQAGLVCTGLTMWSTGNCNPDWMQGTFEGAVPVAVPAAAGAVIDRRVVVIGQASVPEDLEVAVDLTGVDARRLRLTLTDPNGAQAVVWDGGAATLPARMIALGQISRDDMVNGAWTLTVETTAAGAAGTITGWRLFLTSRFD
ncbi:MAG: hypothetical protein H6709_09625 [Kofleriaceae bacterium]|nr:hypothetical protein [Kofleriaceae bacterium]